MQGKQKTLDQLNQGWTEPKEDWLDYFCNRNKLTQLLADKQANKDLIERLCIQFAEKAAYNEREATAILVKNFPKEDVTYLRRKAAAQWLCCMSCLATLDWNTESLTRNAADIPTIRIMLDRLLSWTRDTSLCSDAWFGEFVWWRWVLHINRINRLPPPPAKPTVSNPLAMPDSNLSKFEQQRKVVADVRGDSVRDALDGIRKLIDRIDGDAELVAFGVDSFLQAFIKQAGVHLSIALSGENVLVEGLPVPDLVSANYAIHAASVRNACYLMLVEHAFSGGRTAEVRTLLGELSAAMPTHDFSLGIAAVDVKRLAGFCKAFRIPLDASVEARAVVGAKPLRQWKPRHLLRWQAEKGTKAGLKRDAVVDVCVSAVVEGTPMLVRERLAGELDSDGIQRFAQAVAVDLCSVRAVGARARAVSLLRLLCAAVPTCSETLKAVGISDKYLRPLAPVVTIPSTHIPSTSDFRGLLVSNDPTWDMLNAWTVADIKASVQAAADRLAVPAIFKYPELLADAILTRPVNDYHAILIAKLEQLKNIGDNETWSALVNDVTGEVSAGDTPAQKEEKQSRLLLEAINVKTAMLNEQLNACDVSVAAYDLDYHRRTVTNILSWQLVSGLRNVDSFYIQNVAFLLNCREWMFVLEKIDSQIPIVIIAKLLAAFFEKTDPGARKQIVDAWHGYMLAYIDTQYGRRRSDGNRPPPASMRQKIALRQLIELVREPSVVAFLISYLCSAINMHMKATKKPQLLIFSQYADSIQEKADLASIDADYVAEMLDVLFATARRTEPHNAFYIRSRADVHYVRGELAAAAEAYVECMFACNESLHPPFPDNVVDERVWSRLAVCLAKQQHTTLSALCAQFCTNDKGKQLAKAYDRLRLAQESGDCADACFPLIWDEQLAEFMSEAYDASQQHHRGDKLIAAVSVAAMNPNNRGEIASRERTRRGARFCRVLAAQLFAAHM